MGKRLPKAELLTEIDDQREQLMSLLNKVPKTKFHVRGMNSAQWSIKDVLTHLLDWEQRTVKWCEAGLKGETPEVPGDGFKWNQTMQLNALIQKRHARKSIKQVFEELDQAHRTTLKVIKSMSNKQLTNLNHFDWTGKSWTASDYLLANTANHYRWARNKIRKWLASLEG